VGYLATGHMFHIILHD